MAVPGGRRFPVRPLLLLTLLPWLASCSDAELDEVGTPPVLLDQADPSQRAGASGDGSSPGKHSLVLEFTTSGGRDLLASTGDPRLQVSEVTWGDGEVVADEEAPDGHALRFPGHDPGGEDFAILRVVSRGTDDLLSPEGRDFVFGADVALDAVTTGTAADDGDNLVQRGLYESTSQYKIQVDDGRVSCRVAGVLGEVVVEAPGRLRPGDWYRIRCRRDSDRVTLAVAPLSVPGPRQWVSRSGTGRIGPVLMASAVPLSVGGKLSWSGELLPSSTDQFNGLVDRVHYRRW